MKNIALFASGSGTNVENIIKYFQKCNCNIQPKIILSNKKDAYVLKRAEMFNIKSFVFNHSQLNNTNDIIDILNENNIEYIILAGFLWLIPSNLIKAYPNKIINIHPALLPKYGGKGMYGDNVHKQIVKNKETESGITIHFVNEKYDEGNIIFQAKCNILPTDTADDVANKIHKLEYNHFPKIIERVINK